MFADSSSGSPADERFWPKVKKTEACWLWMGSKDRKGYGQFWNQKKLLPAHRWSYERFVGPIPVGLQIDHLCRTHACVNPAHLEAVTQRENILRGEGVCSRNAAKTHCPQGHALTPENLVRAELIKRGYRTCRECANAWGRRYQARRYQAAKKAGARGDIPQ